MATPDIARYLRVTAAIAAAVALLLLVLLTWEMRHKDASRPTLLAAVVVHALMMLAAARGWTITMLVLFVVAFLPIGIYLLGSPAYHISLIGVGDMVYFLAAIALLTLRWRSKEC